uniref:Single-stranded DNA binding protein n=1 Tax=Agarophyton chilense TaxID=2510777 RepID=A0A141SEJ6_AGACH|nr:hypothetical protein Gchil_053 [Agarophyton chilense]AMK96714.1 hypothetical protein Gchil_053 [Agarophyton chilense]ASP44609.1 hypothetical protein [Agarophyton chilense]UAD84357.1 hypothetical protein [Agarophyton chilense]
MNIFICTIHLLTQPKLIRAKDQNFCYMVISLHNFRDHISNIKMKALAKGKVAKQIFNLYKQKNTMLIESSIHMKKIRYVDNYKKTSKMIFIKIHKIHNSSV